MQATPIDLTRRAIGWGLGICLILWALKLHVIGWYLIAQKTNPLFEAPPWAWPLVGGMDLAFCFALAVAQRVMAGVAWRLLPGRAGRIAVSIATTSIGAAVILFSVVSLEVAKTYAMPLGMDLLRWADDPRVFYSSVMDYATLLPAGLALAGTAMQVPLSRWIARGEQKLPRIGESSWRLWTVFGLLAILAGGGWQRALGGMDMLGVKHNAVVYFIRHFERADELDPPAEVIARTDQTAREYDAILRRPHSLHAPATRPRDFAVGAARPADGRFNFVLIQLESSSAAHIDARTMPNLMRLAEHGVSFQHHFTIFARTDVATYGLYYSDYLPDMKSRLRPFFANRDLPQRSLADALKSAGYRTGVFHSGFFSFVDLGYYLPAAAFDRRVDAADLWDGKQKLPWSWGVREEKTVDALLGWIDSQRDPAVPFMAIYATMYPHHPYWSPVEPSPFPVDTWLNRYRNALWYVDRGIGRIVEHLEATGRLDRTVLVIFGDHGESVSGFPVGHGIRLSDEELRTPLILSNPRLFPSARASAQWTNHLDIAPTVAALAGAAAPDSWLGRDLLSETFEPRLLFLTLGFARTHLILDNGVIHAREARKHSSALYGLDGSPRDTRIVPLPPDDPARANLNRYDQLREAFDPWASWRQAQRARERER